MEDSDCVRFLQQVLPKLQMQWVGFRRVRKQVCKRIQRRISSLGLSDIDAYCEYLRCHTEEWLILDHACRVTVSRFYRDKVVLEHVRTEVFPALILDTMEITPLLTPNRPEAQAVRDGRHGELAQKWLSKRTPSAATASMAGDVGRS